MPAGVYSSARNAARGYARKHGIVSDRFGHLYAASSEAMRELPAEVRGEGRLRPDSSCRTPELALLVPGKDPRYAKVMQGYDLLTERLLLHGLIYVSADECWRLTPPQLLEL